MVNLCLFVTGYSTDPSVGHRCVANSSTNTHSHLLPTCHLHHETVGIRLVVVVCIVSLQFDKSLYPAVQCHSYM